MVLRRITRNILNVEGEKVGDQTRSEFETGDLNLASFLYCRNFPFLEIKSRNDGRKICVFADTSELRYAVADYDNDGVVPARTFCTTLKDLRDMTD